MTQALKHAVAYALYYLGVFHLLQAVMMRNRAVVLMYHRVLTHDQREHSGSHPGIVVTPDTFARHLALLKRRFAVLTLSEFADRFARGVPFESSSCLITFDDGWHDNLTNALPLLRQYGLPAVIFLPVNYIGTSRYFWREGLTHVLLEAARRSDGREEERSRLAGILSPFGLGDLLDRWEPGTASRIIERVSTAALTPDDAERLLERLSIALSLDLGQLLTSDRFLDWTDIDTLAAHGVAFGGHGSEHVRLAEVPLETARQDIERSRTVLDDKLGCAVCSFAYPNGSWNANIAEQVRATGYQLSFTTEPGLVTTRDDPFALKRVNVHEAATLTPPLFMARVLGLF